MEGVILMKIGIDIKKDIIFIVRNIYTEVGK